MIVPRFPVIVLLTLLLLGIGASLAQNSVQSQRGDPPNAALITISPPNDSGIVTISGAAGSVFPGAQVAIRNLYTEAMVYAQAGLSGTFSADIFGPGNTPFWISPAVSIPTDIRNRPGSLPGGPGTIIYGTSSRSATGTLPVTQLIIDGQLADWAAYPQARLLSEVYGLHNSESLYIAFDGAPDTYWKLRVTFTLEGATYELLLDPRLPQEAATWKRTKPTPQDLGVLAVSTTQNGSIIELRIPWEALRALLGTTLESSTLEQLDFLDVEGGVLQSLVVAQTLPAVDEIDGLVIAPEEQLDDPVAFTISGPVAQGAAYWHAPGRINRLDFMPGDHLRLQLDVTLMAPDMPDDLVGLDMIGTLSLQPLNDAEGYPVSGGINSNNGWSMIETPSGLAIDNLRSDFLLGETRRPASQVLRQGDQLIFGLDFDLTLPEDLPSGSYGLMFQGMGQIGDDAPFRWEDSSVLGSGQGVARVQVNRLPLVLNVGEISAQRHLIWSLFQDQPSDGSRGVLSQEDQARVALSNRVRYNSPTYILPPYTDPTDHKLRDYPLEPYVINQLPNAYDSSTAPLIPFSLPGGQLSVRVTRPDGTMDDLGQVPITQNRLSTDEMDERQLFGAESQVDVYRLTTLNPQFRNYQFDQYGTYSIKMQGSVEDLWGNRYEGGGTYEVVVAELLDMQPGVLSGTPFEVGDMFYPGLEVSPGAAADVTVTARIYPLDGSPMIEHEITGKTNDYGYFAPEGETFSFDVPGEYVVDYEARYTDSAGRLWAGSLRSAGVIASPDGAFILHGRRGLDGYTPDIVPAWFTTKRYGPADGIFHLNFPYQRGDLLWYTAGSSNTVQPGLSVQDIAGDYSSWLSEREPVDRQAARAELPLDNVPGTDSEIYSYLSAVRPGLTVRQFVQGSDDPTLPLYWDMEDPYNQQIGSGLNGDLPGDYVFLFGGAIVRNAGTTEAAIYASSGIATDEHDPWGARVMPPYRGEAGTADGGPILTLRGNEVEMFFHPTSIRPGQILQQGDTLALAGQIAPTLDSMIDVTITGPDGSEHSFSGQANAIGYFYDPAQDLLLDQPGIWTVKVKVWHEGWTSAGPVHEPYPQGGMLGSADGSFAVYVMPPNGEALQWNDTREDFSIPGAIPYNFNFRIPSDWTNVTVHHTVTNPAYILQDGPITPSGVSFSYQYNPTNLNAAFPNLEVDARLEGAAAADPVVLTFAVTGTDADGHFQMRSRMFTIFYDRLISLEAGS